MNFSAAVKYMDEWKNQGNKPLSNTVLLELYGWFKQAREGDNRNPMPSFWQPKEQAKWNAWMEKKGYSKDAAEKKYIAIVNQLK